MVVRVPKDHNGIYCACGFRQYDNPPGLGDRVAAALAKIGITEQRYKAAKAAVGLTLDCNCKKRQRALNRVKMTGRAKSE